MASLAQDLTRKFVGDRKEDIESGRWIKVQQRVFTRWANAYLKTRKLHMEVHTVGGFCSVLWPQAMAVVAITLTRQPTPLARCDRICTLSFKMVSCSSTC